MTEYNRDLVLAKVKQCFPHEDEGKIMSIIDSCGVQSSKGLRLRVQIAVLKLSEGNLGKLRKNVDTARADYRDVIVYAENPEWMSKNTGRLDPEEEGRIKRRDYKQYMDWLEG